MKAKHIYEGTQVARLLANEKLPIKGAYAIGRLLKKLEEEFKQLETIRVELVKKHGKGFEDGSFAIDKDDKTGLQLFIEDFQAVLESEIDFSFIPINIDLLGDVSITSTLLSAFDPFLKTPE
jgi:hypothetical protein